MQKKKEEVKQIRQSMFKNEIESKILDMVEPENVLQLLELNILNFTGIELLALLSKVRQLDLVRKHFVKNDFSQRFSTKTLCLK